MLEALDRWLIDPDAFAKVQQVAGAPEKFAALLAATMEPLAGMRKMPAGGGKSIAMIQVAGVMMKQPSWMGGASTLQLRTELQDAAADSEVGAILLLIDSPGGSVSGMADLAADAKAAGKAKPLWAQIIDVGASAAYWLASSASRILASNTLTQVGSIGVYQPLHDLSGAAEQQGIKVHNVTTGPLKGMALPGTPITAEQIAHVQSLVDHVHATFTAAEQKSRGLSAKELAAVTHGGSMPAPVALDAKLIDGIQPLAKTVAELTAAMKAPRQRAEDDAEQQANDGTGRSGATLPMRRPQTLPMLSR